MRNTSVFFWPFTFLFPQIHEKKARVSSNTDPCLTVYLASFYFLPQTKIDFSLYLSRVKSQRSSISLLIVQSIKLIRFDQRLADKMSGKGAKGLIMGKTLSKDKDKDKKKPVTRSSRAGLQVLCFLHFFGFGLLGFLCCLISSNGSFNFALFRSM